MMAEQDMAQSRKDAGTFEAMLDAFAGVCRATVSASLSDDTDSLNFAIDYYKATAHCYGGDTSEFDKQINNNLDMVELREIPRV